jgi:hypothetical protein
LRKKKIHAKKKKFWRGRGGGKRRGRGEEKNSFVALDISFGENQNFNFSSLKQTVMSYGVHSKYNPRYNTEHSIIIQIIYFTR